MKREIKFRAWHVAEKLMCDIDVLTPAGAFLIGVKNAPDDYFNGGKSIIISPKNGRFCKHEDIDLMQFTGLRDKNGKEIYEGDIIAGYAGSAEVIWDDTGSGFDPFTLPGLGGHEWDRENPSDVEVIGNIYENPELLSK